MVFPDFAPLIPLPVTVVVHDGRMPVTTSTRVIGESPAADTLIAALVRRGGPTMTRVPAGETPHPGDIVLRIDADIAASEGSHLTVDSWANVVGADEAGLFYAVHTFLQLLDSDDQGWSIPHVDIHDAPRFAHRGVMLDVARHFYSVSEVTTFIDATSALGINRLHLHLSDDQGWRIHIDTWPLLTERASSTAAGGDPGGFYSKDDYRAIVAHAAARHMIVIPEIDLPGHTHAVGVAYPELVEAPVLGDELLAQSARLDQPLPVTGEPYLGWGVGHSSLRVREERTYDFVRDVVREIAEMTPGPYLHIGGDESLGTSQVDFDYFAERVTKIVVDAGKTPVAWHEMGAAPDIAEGTIGQYWGMRVPTGTHAAEAAHFVERGGALILSPADAIYLDMKYDEDYPLGLDWAGTVDVRQSYDWEPTAVLDVPEAAILGIEAPIWSETTRTIDEIERLVFPRVAAVAEIAWSPRESHNWESFRRRLGLMAPLWKAEGVRFHSAADIPWSDQ